LKIKLQIVILLFIGLSPCWSAEGNESDTNLAIFKNLYYKGFSKAFQEIAVLDSVPLFFYNINKNETIDWLIEQQFVKSARDAGFITLVQSEGSTNLDKEKIIIAAYRSVLNNVNYTAMSLLPENNLYRQVNIEFYVKISDSDHRVLFSDDFKEVFSDTIKVNNIKNIENNNLPFTIGNRSKSLVSRLLEPLLVTLITGSIIYIFYSFRSN